MRNLCSRNFIVVPHRDPRPSLLGELLPFLFRNSGGTDIILEKLFKLVRIGPVPAGKECAVRSDNELHVGHAAIGLLQSILHVIYDPGNLKLKLNAGQADVLLPLIEAVGLTKSVKSGMGLPA
ncbi:hypothetical protein ES703_73520 [subsurface metagenome]